MTDSTHTAAHDTFNLARFLTAQEGVFHTALKELKSGRKKTHWMWFIFPQIDGLGSSLTARKFAIRSIDEARAYLNHPDLGPRLIECCRALLGVDGKSATDIMGYPDDLKLQSCMTLFGLLGDDHPEFNAVLTKYFAGQPDTNTLKLLNLRQRPTNQTP
jgi:uncharacterized protein (DUF1810 family)